VNRCSKILIVTVIILIMSGGILLTTNNIRDLQGMKKTHITITIPDKNVISSYIDHVNKQIKDRAVPFLSWFEKVIRSVVPGTV
jgi:uncharacterized membrane protein